MPLRHLLHYEAKHQPLLSRVAFLQRMAKNFGYALLLVSCSLLVGMAGYHFLEGLDWIDAFVNAAMILSGMGPVANMQTWGGKLFAGFYALYSGFMVIFATGILLAPLLHRMIHKFHLEEDKEK